MEGWNTRAERRRASGRPCCPVTGGGGGIAGAGSPAAAGAGKGARRALPATKKGAEAEAVARGPRPAAGAATGGGGRNRMKAAEDAQITPPAIRTKGVRVQRAKSDGLRVLVARHAPYKVKKEAYDRWCADLAPSGGLLRRYRRGEIAREGFQREYMNELRVNVAAYNAACNLRDELAASRRVTLLFDTRDGRGHDERNVPHYHQSLCGIIEEPRQIRPGSTGGAAPAAPSIEPGKDLRARLTDNELGLRARIMQRMIEGGFTINPHLKPERYTKEAYRRIQRRARDEQMMSSRAFLSGALEKARRACPDGTDIDPAKISLEIRVVEPGTDMADLFRWWNLTWWSMPYQRAYGRQIRLMLWDRHHDAPFGLVSLQSPVLRMGARDSYLGIDRSNAELWANMSMNAQRVGALPPYNGLIGGKMAALAMTSDEVRKIYRKRYMGRITVMRGRVLDPKLLFITTTSAFGRSSTYDRLTYKNDGPAAIPIGFTSGDGTFHLPDDLTREMYKVMEARGVSTKTTYGNGPSRKIKIFKQAFRHLGLSGFQRHGIRRQVYLFPLATNLHSVIAKGKRQMWVHRKLVDIEGYWKERWAMARSRRTTTWKEFKASDHFNGVASILDGA